MAFFITYLIATELNSSSTSAAEFLVFRRGHAPKKLLDAQKAMEKDDAESADNSSMHPIQSNLDEEQARKQNEKVQKLARQTDIFSWKDVQYTVPVKGGTRLLLDNVSGWVKPGTLTALMGASGAGKTTLLNVLAERVDMGVITGDMLVSGKARDASFQRKTGYVQQQDLHLDTTTVREALKFSAYLRQPKTVSRKEKDEFVEDVIKMLKDPANKVYAVVAPSISSQFSYAKLGQVIAGLKELGFGTDKARKGWGTDYAKANGLFVYSRSHGSHSPYWSRTQSTSNTQGARCIKSKGELGYINVITEDEGMRPACKLDLTKVAITGGAGTMEEPFTIAPLALD